MHRFLLLAIIGCLALVGADRACAQQARRGKDPHVGYVFPAGAKQGSLVEVTVGGQFLEGVNAVRLSGQGLDASIVKYTRPMTQKEFNELRDKLMEARMKAADMSMMNGDVMAKKEMLFALAKEIGISDETIQSLLDYRKKLMDPKRQLNPQLTESVIVKILVAPNAPLGIQELRLVTPGGISNPIHFCVGDLPESTRAEEESKIVTPIESLPVTLNGQILPGHVDRYSFTARKGQHLLVRAYVRRLIPYLADAVPGWFQAGLSVLDAKNREVAHAENFRYDPDPVLFFEVPADGAYTLEIKDALYRGREDFIYRVTIGELPFVTGIFPLGGREGEKVSITASGWNLPEDKLATEKWPKTSGVQSIAFAAGAWQSNAVPFEVDTLPEVFEKEPNDDPATAQVIPFPVIVNGRIDKPGDRDVYAFDARGGDSIVAEVMARRLGSPLDSILVLTDSNGKQLAVNDDHEDKGQGLLAQQTDSLIAFTLPSNGRYYLRIGDTQHKGGPDFAYRLRLSRRQPDFALRVVPSCINVRAGSVVLLSVYALRQDGYDGAIDLDLKNGPPGAVLDGARIAPGCDMVRLTLTVPSTATLGTSVLSVVGKGTSGVDVLERTAIPADDMMQAFMYRHLVPASEQLLSVVEPGKLSLPVKINQSLPAKLRRGEATRLRFNMLNPGIVDTLQFELNDPPDGVTLKDVDRSRSGVVLEISVDGSKIKGDLSGNLIINISMDRTPPLSPAKPNPQKQKVPLGVLPAIPFEVTN